MVGRILGENGEEREDLLRRSNGRACLAYDELEVSLIKIESVINARPLNYIGEGADYFPDPLPITPNQFLNNRDQHLLLRSPLSICWLLHSLVLYSSNWISRGGNTSATFVPASSRIM
jgi:hypothetical protein